MSRGGLDAATPIAGAAGGQTLGDFWAWGYSNILTNNLRGVFAEFLVGTALGEAGGMRTEWDAFDVLYGGAGIEGGAKIEVKSSAYLQSWDQAKPSAIVWGVGKRYALDPATNDWTTEKGRHAHLYVFCVYTEREDRDPAKVLDLEKWEFSTSYPRRSSTGSWGTRRPSPLAASRP